jgi:hypothetical protein
MGYRAKPNSPKRADGKDKYNQGPYHLINPGKYLGDPECIWYRSGWEYKMYFFLDNEPRVVHWNVEGMTIPYEIQVNEKWETRRYHPDFYAEIQQLDGSLKKVAVEIKPHKETVPPEMPKKITAKSLENHEYRMKLFLINFNKWKAAKAFCNKRGIEFHVMDETFFNDHSVKIF